VDLRLAQIPIETVAIRANGGYFRTFRDGPENEPTPEHIQGSRAARDHDYAHFGLARRDCFRPEYVPRRMSQTDKLKSGQIMEFPAARRLGTGANDSIEHIGFGQVWRARVIACA
jgi:hypothetical protein